MGAKPKRRSKWGSYLKKGLEYGALGAVQFVPGLDVIADAAVAGEAAEGAAVAGEAAEGLGTLEKGANLYNKASGYYDQYQQYKGYYDQLSSYRQPPQVSYRGQAPVSVPAAAYRTPPQHYLGPLQKKLLIFGVLFLIAMIILVILARHFISSFHGCSKSI